MVKSLTILAVLASMALAAPVTTSTSAQAKGKVQLSGAGSSSGEASGSIAASAGFNATTARAFGACVGGAASSSCSSSDKAAFSAWLNGAGAAYFDAPTCGELKAWASATDAYIINSATDLAVATSLSMEAAVSASGSILGFLNGVVVGGFAEASEPTCLCAVLSGVEQSALLTFLLSSAAQDINAAIAGSLNACAKGGMAASLTAEATSALSDYLASAECSLSEDLKTSVGSWLDAIGTTTAKVGTAAQAGADTTVVLTAAMIGDVNTFIAGTVFPGLSGDIQAGMHACAKGGVAGAMSVGVHAAMSGFLSDSSCPLDAALKASMGLWVSGATGTGVEAAGSATYSYTPLSLTIAGNMGLNGALTTGAQASLTTFCKGSVGAALDSDILGGLNACAKGGLASSLAPADSLALSEYVSGSSCALSSELRGTVIAWMSFGAAASSDAKFNSTSAIDSIDTSLGAASDISPTLKGAIGAALSGSGCDALSPSASSELIAYLLSPEGLTFCGSYHGDLLGWATGSMSASGVLSIEGSGSTGSSKSLPGGAQLGGSGVAIAPSSGGAKISGSGSASDSPTLSATANGTADASAGGAGAKVSGSGSVSVSGDSPKTGGSVSSPSSTGSSPSEVSGEDGDDTCDA